MHDEKARRRRSEGEVQAKLHTSSMSSEARNGKAIPPGQSLPLDSFWADEDSYVRSLLCFATTSELFRNLCGGVHILDFLTREPDLYKTVLPQEWRDWFNQVDVHDVLQLILREDLELLVSSPSQKSWHNGPIPPQSLVVYALTIRRHCLLRSYIPTPPGPDSKAMPRRLAAGMKPKKVHEVQHFSAYVDRLSLLVAEETGKPVSGLVDFGSGQNYLGRALASPPYHQDVIAIERRHHNVAGARRKDVYAKLAKREKIMRNKKEYKRMLVENALAEVSLSGTSSISHADRGRESVAIEDSSDLGLKGSITYIEHNIENGRIEDVIYPPDCNPSLSSASSSTSDECLNSSAASRPNLMVLSLHSCGNLSHHGLRTLSPSLNPSIAAVALIGCCYNLLTERLGPTTYKHPLLRPHHPRLEATGSAYDPHGFPMSRRLEEFANPDGSKGVRLNITARMMAVQAPYNWGRDDSEAFFTRHFYRALLQRMLTDAGIVKESSGPNAQAIAGGSISGRAGQGTPLVIGSLGKSAFTSFSAYGHAALEKLAQDPEIDSLIRSKGLVFTDDLVRSYETRFAHARKQLAVMWSLMAFSAGVVESIIVVDRWLWLREQVGWIGKSWVEPVFDYKHSPRNLVVVGIRKRLEEQGKEKEDSRAGMNKAPEESQDSD
jgi:Methyltransferase domain